MFILGYFIQFHLNAYVNGSIAKFYMLLLCILTYDIGKCATPSLILCFNFVFLFRGTKKNNMTVKISFCIFCQILILITSNLEMCLCINVLLTMGYLHIY